ncbi:hypothetical protein J5N97_027360 [Dioscorea zingiberensis]|uniref:B-like cyclin n=1 Tax=Dioscorea zingiberensis TaxID=325984 RepID=A0A9D5C526_9LILI|nr:hypothetical protein J5N97_027360 [Dioscorea zingiberensis]
MIVERVITIEYLDPSMSQDLLCKFPDDSAFGFDYSQSEIWSPLLPHGRHGSHLHLESLLEKSSKGKLRKVKGMLIEKKLKKKKKRMSSVVMKNLDFSSSSTPVKGWRRVLRAATKRFKGQKRSSMQRLLPALFWVFEAKETNGPARTPFEFSASQSPPRSSLRLLLTARKGDPIMVSFKGRETKVGGGIRILEDPPRPPKNSVKDFKIRTTNERGKLGDDDTSAGASRTSARQVPKSMTLRKSAPANPTLSKSTRQNGVNSVKGNLQNVGNSMLKSDKSGKIRTGRKALADLSNVNQNHNKSHQLGNPFGSNKKTIKCKTERSNILESKTNIRKDSHGPRISLTKNVTTASASLKKPMMGNIRRSEAAIGKSNISVNIGMRRQRLSEGSSFGKLQGNRLSYGSKPIKSQGLKLPQSSKLSLATQRVMNSNASSRKSFRPPSKLKSSPVINQKFVIKNSASSSLSSNKELELTSKTEGDHNASVTLQDCVSGEGQLDGSLPTNDKGTTVISRLKCKRRRSYTSSLVARSEVLAECTGSVEKYELPNIDDSNNPLEVVDYVDDIYQYYWAMEVQNPSLANYMTIQSEITPRMRGILINWLIEVHFKFELMQETLFLMVELLDRLLSLVTITKNDLQMVGLTSLLLASKYEDFWHPKIAELISISANLYTRDDMLAMEKLILTKLRFRLNIPTPYVFMIRFLKAAQSEKKLEHLAFYLIELCLVEYEALRFKPSLLCASAIYVARCTLHITPVWTGLLKKHAHYEEPELRACANMILGFHVAASQQPVSFTYEKFQSPDRGCVAKLKPLDKLPL